MITPVLKTISTSVRPARVAVLLDSTDEDWRGNALRVIAHYSTTWGGFYNIIIPTDGNRIEERFWNILDVYDPDFLGCYYKTLADKKLNYPEAYEQDYERYKQHVMGQYADIEENTLRSDFDRLMTQQQVTRPLSEGLQIELRNRISPFHFEERVIEIGIGLNSRARYPLAPLSKILPNCNHARNLALHWPDYGDTHKLWRSSMTGLATPEYQFELNSFGIAPNTTTHDIYTSLRFLVNNGAVDAINVDVATPYDLTRLKLGMYLPSRAHEFGNPIIVIVGDTVSDFCLYYSLSRLRPQVTWLPVRWLKSQANPQTSEESLFDIYSLMLQSSNFKGDAHPKYIFASQSLDEAGLNNVIQELSDSRKFSFGSIKNNSSTEFNLSKILDIPLRLYEEDNVDRQTSMVIREGAYIDVFNTPKPKNFTSIDPYEHRWITDVNVINYKLPRHYALGNWVVRHRAVLTNTVRVGKTGISYLCPHSMYFGGDIDTSTIRPTIFIPTALQIFEKISESVKHQVRISDKGYYAQESINKLGNLSTIGSVLRDNAFRGILVKYLDQAKPALGVHDEGALLNDRRRYLNLPAISKIVGDDSRSQKIIEMLVQMQVLYRGYVFKCRFCRGADWFSVEEISQDYKCKRCSRSQFITKENYWYGEYEPGWYYKLDEIVYLFLFHNGDVPILTLDFLREKSEEGFLYTTDLEVFEDGTEKPLMELDIACVCDGMITIGEAKKNNTLADNKAEEIRTVEKYYKLALLVGANQLVFATSSESWSQRTLSAIEHVVADKRVRVTLLSKNELLSS